MDATSMSEVISAANFVTGSVLACVGIVVIVATILIVNNLFTRFWRPVKIFYYVEKEVDPNPGLSPPKADARHEPNLS